MTFIHESLSPEVTAIASGSEFVVGEQRPPEVVTEEVQVFDEEHQPNRLQRAIGVAKTAMLSAVVAFEAMPVSNEGTRAAVFATTQAAYGNPFLTAIATAAATFSIEASGSMAAANLLDGPAGRHIHKGLDKVGLSGVHTNAVTESAAAMAIGVPLTMTLKQQQDPTRSEKQNRRYGLIASAGVSSAVGLMGLMTAEGMSAFEAVPEKVGVGVLAIGGLAWAAKKMREFVKSKNTLQEGTAEAIEKVAPNYDLEQDELDRLEKDLVERVRKEHGKTVASVWVPSDSPYANFIRTHESQTFSKLHVPDLFRQYEDESAFLVMVDTRKGKGRAIRGTRLSSPRFNAQREASEHDEEVRIAMIQDMIATGQFTNEEFVKYYKERGIDPNKCISVETNFRIGERAPRVFGVIPMAHVAYLAMCNFVTNHDLDNTDVSIFAHINSASRDSLTRLGVPIEPLMGNENLRTPAGGGEFDDDFRPIALLNEAATAKRMRRLKIFAPREMRV